MGDYYSLDFAAPLHAQGLRVVTLLNEAQMDKDAWGGSWGAAACAFPHPDLVAYAQMDRASFIPFGATHYAPEGWEHRHAVAGSTWQVTCSIKTHAVGTVEWFLHVVLPLLIAEPVTVRTYHELTRKTDNIFVAPKETTWPNTSR